MILQKFVTFVNKNFKRNMLNLKYIVKVVTIVIMQVNIEMLHITYVI